MEVQACSIQCLAVILLTIINCFVLASSNGQTCYIDKYIAESYFKKYDSLVDQEFDDFLENNIPLGSCKVLEDKNHILPSLSAIYQNVIGEGSHRQLSSSLRLNLPLELKHELAAHSCKVVVIERLPSGAFADPFELQHLVLRGVFTDAAVFGDTNLELPSFRSNQSVMEIHMSTASKVIPIEEDDSEVDLEVPLHARYQINYWVFGCTEEQLNLAVDCILISSTFALSGLIHFYHIFLYLTGIPFLDWKEINLTSQD